MSARRKPTRRMLPEMRELAAANLGLAYSRARRMARLWPGLPEDDFLGEALLALTRAAWGWDPDHGVAFSTYAIRSIDRGLCEYVTRERRRQTVSLEVFAGGTHYLRGAVDLYSLGDLDEALSREQTREAVRAAIATGTGICALSREVLLARLRWPTPPYSAIARELGVSKQGAIDAAHRAYPRLRELLADGDGPQIAQDGSGRAIAGA